MKYNRKKHQCKFCKQEIVYREKEGVLVQYHIESRIPCEWKDKEITEKSEGEQINLGKKSTWFWRII